MRCSTPHGEVCSQCNEPLASRITLVAESGRRRNTIIRGLPFGRALCCLRLPRASVGRTCVGRQPEQHACVYDASISQGLGVGVEEDETSRLIVERGEKLTAPRRGIATFWHNFTAPGSGRHIERHDETAVAVTVVTAAAATDTAPDERWCERLVLAACNGGRLALVLQHARSILM